MHMRRGDEATIVLKTPGRHNVDVYNRPITCHAPILVGAMRAGASSFIGMRARLIGLAQWPGVRPAIAKAAWYR